MRFIDCSAVKYVDNHWELPECDLKQNGFRQLKEWKNETIRELKIGRSYWDSLTISHNETDNTALVKIKNSRNDRDGARASGVVLLALLEMFGLDKLPGKIFVDSNPGFSEKAIPLFTCLSDPDCRRSFLKAFGKGQNIEIIQGNGISAAEFEKKVIMHFVDKFNMPTHSDISDTPIFAGDIPKAKRLKADGLLFHNGEVTIIEAKKHAPDFADGVAQLIQNYMLISKVKDINEICPAIHDGKIKSLSCWLAVSKEADSELVKKGLAFLKSDKNPVFCISV